MYLNVRSHIVTFTVDDFFVYKYLMDGETPVAPRDQMRHCQFVHFRPTTCSFLSRPAQCSSLALYNAHHKWMRTLCRCIWDLGREGESRKDSFKFYTRSHELHNNNEINSNMKHDIEMIDHSRHTNEHIYVIVSFPTF